MTHDLGAFGIELSLLATFFEIPWTQPVATLSPSYQTRAIVHAALALRALGRLADAIEPMRAGVEARLESADWENAAINFISLSELHLAVGNVPEAIADAQHSIDFADRGRVSWIKMACRTTLAEALHQSGDLAQATRLFAEAEKIQAENGSESLILYSLWSYRYCELLLAHGQTTEVLSRAIQNLDWAKRYGGSLLDMGLVGPSPSPRVCRSCSPSCSGCQFSLPHRDAPQASPRPTRPRHVP